VFVHGVGQEAAFSKFLKFLTGMARNFGKKPLHLHPAAILKMSEGADLQDVLDRIQQARVSALIGLLGGMPDSKQRTLEELVNRRGVPCHWVAPEASQSRSAAVDLLCELMLLPP